MSSSSALSLWSDDPSQVDLLSFDAVAQTVSDALLDEALDPVALGLSGSWGSGKTTVLGLVAQELLRRKTDEQKVLVIQTDPWRYDPTTGAKESLIAEVLAALTGEIDRSETKTERAKNLLARLEKRIDWAKATTKVLLPGSRFAADGAHGEKKQRVLTKLGVFLEPFFGLSSGRGDM